MATFITPLFSPTLIPAVDTLMYTSEDCRTGIDKLTVSNPNAVAYNITVYWVPEGDSPGVANTIIPTVAIQPGQSVDLWQFIGHTIGIDDMIYAKASVADKLVLFGSGRKYTVT